MTGRILVVDDEPSVVFTLREVLEERGFEVVDASSGEAALATFDDRFDAVVTDLQMGGIDGLTLLARLKERAPRLPVVLLTARGSERVAVRAMRAGAHDYLVKPFDVDELALTVERAVELGALRGASKRLDVERALGRPFVGDAPALRGVIASAVRLSDRDVPVLVTGETGSGKELLASLLHVAGARAKGPLVRFNCAAISPDLAEAELFGHVKGAYTGAVGARRGFFQEADGGTLVLDEIGELPAAIQPKLLRAVQEGEVQPVGAARTEKVAVRIVSCTHRDLRAEIARGRFREDLYYRLAVVELHMPPLRERRSDIPALARALASRAADRFGVGPVALDDDLLAELERRAWPGNVRELDSVVTRMVALADGPVLGRAALEAEPARQEPAGGTLRERLDALERTLIREALDEAGQNQSEAARRLGLPRVTLLDRMRRHGL